jgi:L-rhamnose-H+ transport protein
MSLGNSITLGFCAAFGSIIPPIYYNLFPVPGKVSFNDMIATTGGQLVVLGIVVCIAGIALAGLAGMLKEKDLAKKHTENVIKEFNLWKGLFVATTSGILSACFNFGIEAGKPMAEMAVQQGYNPLFQNNVTYVVCFGAG